MNEDSHQLVRTVKDYRTLTLFKSNECGNWISPKEDRIETCGSPELTTGYYNSPNPCLWGMLVIGVQQYLESLRFPTRKVRIYPRVKVHSNMSKGVKTGIKVLSPLVQYATSAERFEANLCKLFHSYGICSLKGLSLNLWLLKLLWTFLARLPFSIPWGITLAFVCV